MKGEKIKLQFYYHPLFLFLLGLIFFISSSCSNLRHKVKAMYGVKMSNYKTLNQNSNLTNSFNFRPNI